MNDLSQRIFDVALAIYVLMTAALVLLVIILDAWAIVSGQPSVTDRVRDLARREPMLPFLLGGALGALAGHLFWSR